MSVSCRLTSAAGEAQALRFSAWNTAPHAFAVGQGWDEAKPSRKVSLLQKAAYHEIGHLLGYLSAGAPFQVDKVDINRDGSGGVEYPEKRKGSLTLGDRLNCIVGLLAGGVMENAVFGKTDPDALASDRYRIEYLFEGALQEAAQSAPEQLPAIQRFWENREQITLRHLQQYSRPLVDELARMLVAHREWDEETIQTLIKGFRLKQVPSAKKPKRLH